MVSPGSPLYRPGRSRPLGYRFRHPERSSTLVVLGHYERKSGGCDTIRESDGGLSEVFSLADRAASAGESIVMEGLRLSSEYIQSHALACRHELHVLLLTTSAEQCSRNLIRRRRLAGSAGAELRSRGVEERLRIENACEKLRSVCTVHDVDLTEGLRVARRLLCLPETAPR
jgi:hypothetical protein